jgi:hypothetical protein
LAAQLKRCGKHRPFATAANREAAKHFARTIDANMGGTEIGQALAAAYRVFEKTEIGEILLVTDGAVSSWESVVKQAKSSGHRLFTVGVGNAVSESFVRQLASQTGGECELVAPREDMAERIVRHFERIRSPRAKQVKVYWPEGAAEVAPSTLRAVFEGDTVLSFARFDGTIGRGVVVLEAEMETGETLREELPIPSESLSAADSEQISTVARLAALARLKEYGAEDSLQTALHYRLLTERTNWIAILERPNGEKALDIPALRKTAQMPAAAFEAFQNVRICESRSERASNPFFRRIASSFGSLGAQFERASMSRTEPHLIDLSTSSLSSMIEFLVLIPETEWISISAWASQEGHLDIAQEAKEFLQLLRTLGITNINEVQARNGLMLLVRAVGLGFKMSKVVEDEACRRGILSGHST